MPNIKIKYGTLTVEDTEVNGQVKIIFPRCSDELVEELRNYLRKLGKYEKIINGGRVFSNIIGLQNNNPISEITIDDLEEPIISRNAIRDCIEIFIRTREMTQIERRCNLEKKPLSANQVILMIQSIDMYDKLQGFLEVINI
jgi:hypothetical protein